MTYTYGLKVQTVSIRTKVNAETQLQNAKNAGMTTLDVNMHEGGAHYNTTLFPRCTSIETGFDPLGYIIQRGHELGISIFVWFCPGAYYGYFPQWDMYGKHTNCPKHWLDFSVLAARQKMAEAISDIYAHYTPDGISLDYIRYTDADKTATTPAWWPAMAEGLSVNDITNTVELVKAAIAGRGKLQAHVKYGNWLDQFQDWPNWLKNNLLDQAMPMMYADPNNAVLDGHSIASWITRFLDPLNIDKNRIWPCLAFMNMSVTPNVAKTITQFNLEVKDAKNAGYFNQQYFDNKTLTTEFINYLKEENKMPVKNDLIVVADTIDAEVVVLTNKIAELTTLIAGFKVQTDKIRTLSAQLTQADTMADELAVLL